MSTQWILVADASRAVLLGANGRVDRATQVDAFSNAEALEDVNAGQDDRLGQKGHGSGARAAMQPRHTPKELASDGFARRLVEVLERGRVENLFARLTRVAPAAFLGQLRQHMPTPLQRTVEHELSKDLVREPLPELTEHLARLLA